MGTGREVPPWIFKIPAEKVDFLLSKMKKQILALLAPL